MSCVEWAIGILPPMVIAAGLFWYTRKLWIAAREDHKKCRAPVQGSDLQVHSERIYKDFEFFVKVFLALGAGVGAITLSPPANTATVGRLTFALAVVGWLAMLALTLSIICHQASKIRRWPDPRLYEWWRWQEVWLVSAMFLLATGLWVWWWWLSSP